MTTETPEVGEATDHRGRASRLMRMLRVRPEETTATLWTAALFTVSQANQGLGLNAADTLFFLRFGVEFLPTMILVSGPVVMVGILVYAAGLGRIGSQRWLPAAFLACGALLVAERVGIGLELPGIYPVVWLVGQLVMVLSLTAMWTAAAEVCTTRQAKRLYPLFASAGIAGGVIANAATGPLAHALGTENLLLVQAALLAMAAALALNIGRRFFRGGSTGSGDSVVADFKAGLETTLASPLLRIVAGVGVTFGALLFLVVFPFSEVVTFSFQTEAEVAGYLGLFAAVATATTFVVSLFLTNRLFGRFGVVATLMIVPLVYVGGFGLWLVSLDLATATVVRGLQFVAVNAIGVTAWSSLFNVLPTRRRGQVMAFMTAGPMQLGTMLSGALLLAGAALPQQGRTILALGVALVAVALVIRMRPSYGGALVDAVRGGLVDLFSTATTGIQKPALDADTFRAMTVCLDNPRPEARAMAVAAVARLNEEEADRLLPKALGDDEARVRAAALEVLAARDGEWRRHIPALLADPSADIRHRTLQLMWEEGDFSGESVSALLYDPAPRVRGMAAAIEGGTAARRVVGELLGSGEPEQISAGLTAVGLRPDLSTLDLTGFIGHGDRRVRAAAAPVVAGRPGGPPLVQRLLDDPSILTRRSAASALSQSPGGVAALLHVLEVGSVRATDAALSALARSGQAGGDLAVWASQEITRAAYLHRHRMALQEGGLSGATAGYLVRLLTAREERLERWAVMALTTPRTEPALATVMRGLWSDDPETRSQALEALDSIGERSVVRELITLLEGDGPELRSDARWSLRVLTSDMDDWIRALAIRCLSEELTSDLALLAETAEKDPSPLVRVALSRWEVPAMQEAETLDLMERVLALQRVPMFSAIDPEDLEKVAMVTAERHFEAEERIFSEGEEGDEMLVIIRGEAVVSRESDGERRTIRTYVPGDHVGELALLRRRPRASDVTAGPDGMHALALRGPELQAILEERPEVAMAMLGTLAERLATM